MSDSETFLGLPVANLHYDASFKFMMQDSKFAKAFIGSILEVEVLEFERLESERTIETEVKISGKTLRVIRYDFKAVIIDAFHQKSTLLIELQWRPNLVLLMRFRNYLGAAFSTNYQTDELNQLLPIVSIYILGHKLAGLSSAVTRVSRALTDIETQEQIKIEVHEPFIESLSHEFVVIQTPRLAGGAANSLTQFLFLFNSDYVMSTPEKQVNTIKQIPDTEMARYSARLAHRALADPQTRYLMNIEDEIALEIELNEQLIADEKSLKEAALLREEDERSLKEAAILEAQDERSLKEAAILREEQTIQQLASSVKKMKEMGLSLVEIANTIGLSEIEVNDLLKR